MQSSLHGFLVVDKPGGLTSRDVVNRVQGCLPRRTRIGHTGTLDPLATGVLVLCVGQATRLTEYVQDMDKVYQSVFRLGVRSDTDDADGTVQPVVNAPIPDRATVERTLTGFLGEIDQVPPAYSAAKVSGRRAYDLARRGNEVALQARRVHVEAITILAYEYPRLEVEVRCGKGTYIRSLARDLGERLGCGAMVEVLRRTCVGPFTAAAGVTLDLVASQIVSRLLPLTAAVAELPQITLPPPLLNRLRHGGSVSLPDSLIPGATDDSRVAILAANDSLVAITRLNAAKRTLAPEKVLTT